MNINTFAQWEKLYLHTAVKSQMYIWWPIILILKFALFHITSVYFKHEVQNMIGGIFLRRLQLQGLHSLTWWLSSLLGDICNSNLILKEGRNSYSIYGWVIWGERPNLTTANVKGQTWLELRRFEGKSRRGNQTMTHCHAPATTWNETTDWVLKRWTHRAEAAGKVRCSKMNGGFQDYLTDI